MTVEEIQDRSIEGLINVAQLLKKPIGSSHNYEVAEIINEQAANYIKGKITLIRTNRGILVQGKLYAELELMCSRCLDFFLCPISFSLEEEAIPSLDVTSGLPFSLSEDFESFTIDNNHLLDLGELICQYILLNLPMKPLCQPNCAGIKEVNHHGST
ncbi:MAG: DUF177 domain-containing protein [Chloroflexota bacterium]|nr:DUF177 domain-containing protein [Chloroflexota bacterium]